MDSNWTLERSYPKILPHLAANNIRAGWWTSRTTAVNQNICRCCFHDRVKQACSKVASTVVVMKEREKEKDTRKQLQEERKLRDNCCETRKRRSRADIPSIGGDLSYRMSRATFPISIRKVHKNAYRLTRVNLHVQHMK